VYYREGVEIEEVDLGKKHSGSEISLDAHKKPCPGLQLLHCKNSPKAFATANTFSRVLQVPARLPGICIRSQKESSRWSIVVVVDQGLVYPHRHECWQCLPD